MSVAEVSARVGQIQALMAALSPGVVAPVPPAAAPSMAPGASFSDQLASATAPPAAPMASTASVTPVAGGASAYDAQIQQAAQRHGVDPALLKALVRQESNFDPNARSHAGATGLTQLMPATAASLGVTDATDPAQALDGGAKYLRQQLDAFGGDERKALAAYNAGPGAVQRYGGVPPYAETQAYVQKVLGYAAGYRSSSPTPSIT